MKASLPIRREPLLFPLFSCFRRLRRFYACRSDTTCRQLSTRCEPTLSAWAGSSAIHGNITQRSSSQIHCPKVPDKAAFSTQDRDFVDARVKTWTLHEQIQKSLVRGDYQELINVFYAVGNDPAFVRSIPENTFTEVLALLQPKNALGWAKTPYTQLSSAIVEKLRLPSADNLVREHLVEAIQILGKRKNAGQSLSVADYSTILGYARWTGFRDVAETFWRTMQADSITPNLKCYNNSLGAIVSNLGFNPEVRHSRRLTGFRTKARSQLDPTPRHAAYRFGHGGIKQGVMNLHREMTQKDVVPDEETFRLMILGIAREGDLVTVKKILRQVWGIDVDTVIGGSEQQIATMGHSLEPTSPLYPTPFLLYSVAHAFAINNDIPTALRLVDHISRTFNIQIFDYVWHELFNWTFVLSLPRRGSKGEDAHLPKPSVQKIWDMMRNEPYNVRPTLDMYNKLIKSLFVQQRSRDMWHYMCEALPLYKQARVDTRETHRALQRALQRSRDGQGRTPPIAQLHQKYVYSRLVQKVARFWLKRWVRLLLGSMHSWRKVDRDLFWSTIQIPRIVLDWGQFMPSKVQYDIPGGRVDLVFRTAQEKKDFQDKTKRVMDSKDQALNKHSHHLPTQAGDRYKLTRRQQRAAARDQHTATDSETMHRSEDRHDVQPDVCEVEEMVR